MQRRDFLKPSAAGGALGALDPLPAAAAGDFRCFLSTATGFGTVGVRDGKAYLEVCAGQIDVSKIVYTKP
jgi:hypothetical protein